MTGWEGVGAPHGAAIVGQGALPSVFPVTELASGSVAAAGLALAGLVEAAHGAAPAVRVDRRLASFWFATSVRPQGWAAPAFGDPLTGDYRAADGWVRLHVNAPHHRAAALRVLGAANEPASVAEAVRRWRAEALEQAIVAEAGCAAAMRSEAEWAAHPQGCAVAAEPLVHHEPGLAGPVPEWRVPAGRPLRGVRVLDMTRVLAGPVATRFLAGFGAEVLRIDPPWWDEPGAALDMTPGKRCARMDLREAGARARWEALLRGADVLVHGYRPGAMPGLGLDAAARQAIRPGLVDVSFCAYGWSGPWAGRRGFDSLVQMSAGVADTGMRRGRRDRPTPLPVQALDHATGYIVATAALRGLAARLRTGQGSAARASLARTAALLAHMPPGDGAPLVPETDGDLDPAPEPTAWGPARRLTAPLQVAGATMRWDRPASMLGSAPAQWGE